MKQTVKIPANASIWILHLFIAADCGFMGVFQQWRRHRYNAWPYLSYSFLRFLILGILLTLHVKYARLNRKLWYAFLLADGILLVCFLEGIPPVSLGDIADGHGRAIGTAVGDAQAARAGA